MIKRTLSLTSLLGIMAVIMWISTSSCTPPPNPPNTNSINREVKKDDIACMLNCDTATDAQIRNEIYAEIARHGNLRPQLDQINVIVAFHKVKLYGWVANSNDFNQVVGIAKEAQCVIGSPNTDEFYGIYNNPTRIPTTGCSGNMVTCGDICVPSGQCAITSVDTKDVNANTTGNSNSNTAGNSNANTTAKSNTNTNSKPSGNR